MERVVTLDLELRRASFSFTRGSFRKLVKGGGRKWNVDDWGGGGGG